jgi:hypothetical protein
LGVWSGNAWQNAAAATLESDVQLAFGRLVAGAPHQQADKKFMDTFVQKFRPVLASSAEWDTGVLTRTITDILRAAPNPNELSGQT